MTFCQRGKDKVNEQNLPFRPSSKILKVEVLINHLKCSSVLFILELLPEICTFCRLPIVKMYLVHLAGGVTALLLGTASK